jgi:FlaG/FlaF family flagellin (archaellin)
MRIFRTLAVLSGLALVLSACGLVNSLVPDQKVANPLGIDGQTITMSAQPGTAALSPQATGTNTFGGHFSGTFGDINASSIPGGVKPSGFVADIGIDSTATIASTSASSLPATINVTNVGLSLQVNDGATAGGTPSFTLTPPYKHAGTLLVLNQQAGTCSTTSGISCDYAVTAGPDLGAALIALSLSSSDVGTLWQIVTTGSSTNHAAGTVSVTLDQNLPSDATLQVKLVSKEGTLSF